MPQAQNPAVPTNLNSNSVDEQFFNLDMEIIKRTKKTTSNKLILTLPDRLIKEKVEVTVELKDKNKQNKKSSNVKNKVALVNEEQEAGYYTLEWNGNNVSSGVYLYTLKAGDNFNVKKMILLR